MPKTVIGDTLYQYAIDYGVREHHVLTKLRIETAKLTNSHMQISPDQGQFMGLLAKITGAKHYLELGVFTGYSSLAMALAMGADSTVTVLDLNNEYLQIAHNFWVEAGVDNQIRVIEGAATESCAKLIAEHKEFDIAFIDANKTDYPAYYEYCYQLVRIGGLILVDNVLFHGQVLAEKPSNSALAIKKLNELIKNDTRVDICMLPLADGLTIAYKKELP
jgi:predicted O-methyltransferase YrrM